MAEKKVRLQKVLAAAGFGSRRRCEELILDGLVQVNGKTVSTLPVLTDPQNDRIQVGSRVLKRQAKVYIMLNKPKGVICALLDPDDKPTVRDLLVGVGQRVFPVGRLDAQSQGLVLMTNDGELTQRLTHPKYGVPKVYVAQVKGKATGQMVATLKSGVRLSEGLARASGVKIVRRGNDRSTLEITLREGRNRQVRRMLAKVGHPVQRLTRVKIGPLSLRGVKTGRFRPLSAIELKNLKAAAQGAGGRSESPVRRKTQKSALGRGAVT